MNSRKPSEIAMKNPSNRTALLGRASTMTVAAAAAATASLLPVSDARADCFDPGPVNAVNLSSPQECVIIDDPVSNGVVVNTTVAESDDNPAFEVSNVIGGRLVNNGIISNSGGTISGIALDVYGGTINDGITNTGLIESADDRAIRLRLGASVGGIVNSGTISGLFGIDGTEGVTINGDIVNEEGALIEGDEVGIWLHDSGGPMSLYGDILNDGAIEGGSGAIVISNYLFDSSIVNASSGTIRTTGEGNNETAIAAILIDSTFAHTDITNDGVIEGYDAAIAFIGEEFIGNIINRGTIATQGSLAGIWLGTYTGDGSFGTSSINGSISNTGLIDGGEGWGITIISGDIGQGGSLNSLEGGPNVAFTKPDAAFGIENSRDVVGGIYINADQAYLNLVNRQAGLISAFYGDASTGVSLDVMDLVADIQNQGRIEGSSIGMRVGADPYFSSKNLNLSQSLAPESFVNAEASYLLASINNRGIIEGGSTGLAVVATTSFLQFTNSGTISATGANVDSLSSFYYGSDSTGLLIEPQSSVCLLTPPCTPLSPSMHGEISNSGLIQGGDGVGIYLSAFGPMADGLLENSGSIIGESGTGLVVNVDYWYGDIVNSGLIEGAETGAYLYGDTFYGDFINDGEITGGELLTGLHIAYSSFTGNVVNNDLLSAPGNALHIESDTFSGSITNTGTIVATDYDGTAVLLEHFYGSGYYSGGFTNTGLIEGGGEGAGIRVDDASLLLGITNDGGTITAQTAIDTRESHGGMDILNTGGGLIEGNLLFSEDHADEYIGEDGGFRGTMVGTGGEGGEGCLDDAVTVRDGDHYFIGKASTLSAFTVQSGGTAFLGTEGDWADSQVSSLSSPGYFYGASIDLLEVESGGRLYMGEHSNMSVEDYTQSAYGELTYFLTSDESSHGQIRNPGSLSGSATIAGTISVDLDLESFSGTSQTSFTYEDVISTTYLSGEFTNTSVIGSPFFELDVRYQGGEGSDPDTVDLLLSRVSFASLSCSTSSENNESLGQMLEDAFQAGYLTADQLALYLAILESSDGCNVASIYDDLSGTPFDFIAFQLDGPFKKMVGARIDSGRSTGCVVAGSSDCFNRYAADTTGSSTVMNDGTPGGDPFAWLRNGVRQEGTSAVWGRGVGVWGETDGDGGAGAPGSRYNQKGSIVGADHVFTDTFIAGVAAQYTDTDIKFPGHVDRVSVGSYEFGVYASYGDTQGYLNANTSYIWHNFDTYRQVLGSDTKGQFDGGTISACLEVGRIYEADGWRLQPVGALSFASLSTDGYTENGSSPNRLVVKDSGFDSLKSILGGRIAYPVEMESGRRWVPEVRVSWSHEFMDNSAEFDARLFSFAEDPSSYFTTRGSEYDRDSLNLGTGMNAPINDKIIVYLDYDATLSSDQTSHTASGGLRVLW